MEAACRTHPLRTCENKCSCARRHLQVARTTGAAAMRVKAALHMQADTAASQVGHANSFKVPAGLQLSPPGSCWQRWHFCCCPRCSWLQCATARCRTESSRRSTSSRGPQLLNPQLPCVGEGMGSNLGGLHACQTKSNCCRMAAQHHAFQPGQQAAFPGLDART